MRRVLLVHVGLYDDLRQRFSQAAKREIAENGNMDRFCMSVRDALVHATGGADRVSPRLKPREDP